MKIWLINAYGNLPNEGWSEYRTTLMAKALSNAGHDVIWWVSNFEHRSKKFRSTDWKDIIINNNFTIKIVPSTAYYNHISIARIKYENQYEKEAKFVLQNSRKSLNGERTLRKFWLVRTRARRRWNA